MVHVTSRIPILAATAACLAAVSACRSAEPPTAVIVDQLSLTHTNRGFVTEVTTLLEQSGYEVEYLPGEAVSVDLIRSLPQRGDSLVILRMHSARISADGAKTDDVALFTGEPIDLERYNVSGVPAPAATAIADYQGSAADVELASSAQIHAPSDVANLIPVFYDPDSGELPFFGVRPAYVTRSMVGEFAPGSTVILMGCDGLRSPALAEAFLARGAQSFVSWTEPVTAAHTDQATTRLIELLASGMGVASAVTQTMDEIGPDPSYGSRLTAYP